MKAMIITYATDGTTASWEVESDRLADIVFNDEYQYIRTYNAHEFLEFCSIYQDELREVLGNIALKYMIGSIEIAIVIETDSNVSVTFSKESNTRTRQVLPQLNENEELYLAEIDEIFEALDHYQIYNGIHDTFDAEASSASCGLDVADCNWSLDPTLRNQISEIFTSSLYDLDVRERSAYSRMLALASVLREKKTDNN